MGKWLIMLVLIACVASCSTKRAITHVEEENATHAEFTSSVDASVKSSKSMQMYNYRIDSIMQRWVLDFVIYDTSKTDSLGNHPVLAEGKMKNETSNVSVDTTKTIISAESVTDIKEKETTITDNEITIIEERKPKNADAIVLFVLLMIVIFVWKIINKK